jgi:TonB-dependent starch-binding outer membrane protein SusC
MKKILIAFSFLLCMVIQLYAQEGVIKGKVIDKSNNAPLQGVTVTIAGQASSTTLTDVSGNFALSAKGITNPSLTFTYIGFKTITLPLSEGDAGVVELEPVNSSLTDVVVVGYGTVRKRDLTGSVVSVKSEEIKKVPAGNAMEALQGKIPGVDIVRTSGQSGARSNVTVRGNRSILADNGPLYIVDGIQYSNYEDINPADIQSMEVLKDASSTAIYGSRGANGVIIITTKKGASGKVKVSAGAYYGVTDVAGYPKPMNGLEFTNLKRQAFRTIGIWNSPVDDPKVFTNPADLVAIQNGTSTYWPGELLEQGSQQDYNVSLSAGSDKTRVFLSYGFFKEEGLLYNDYSKRHSVRLNVEQALGAKLKVGLQSQLTYYDQNLRSDGVLNQANKVIPLYTPYNADGTLARFPGNANQFNPMFNDVEGSYINQNNITRLLSTAFLEWRPIKDVTFRSNIGITNGSLRNGFFNDANTIDRILSSGSLSRVNNSTSTEINWENIITWQHEYNKHKIGVTALTSYLTNTVDNSSASGTGQLLANQSFYALQNNPANLAISSNYVSSTLLSGAFRVNYSYAGKYLLTVTGRSDGSSVLSDENKWAFFPSAAVAWRVSDEDFMQSQNLFSDLKLRVSYGYAGNSAVRPYSTQSSLNLIPFAWNDVQALAYGLDPQTGNPNLKWELTGTANIGLDFGMWNQRVTGSVDVYDSQTKDLLLQRSLPTSSGVSRIVQNIGRTRNRGIEIGIQTVNISKPNFTWSTGFNFTKNKEEIVELVGGQNDIANRWFIGQPVNSFYDYQKEGIWQTADSAMARSFGFRPGDIRVKDIDGDKRINATNDRVVLGSTVPDYIIGFNNDVKWKGFDINVYIFARQGQMFVSDYANKFEPNAIENGAKVDYWTPENPTNAYPRPNANISRASMPFATTLGYQDGSFIKIRNISLGYTFAQHLTKKIGLSSLRWYVSARNYFVFSKVKDYDPEGGGSFDRPLSKLLVTGINIDF